MSAPRLEIDLDKLYHNARTLVQRLAARGISITGVTKAALGSPEIAEVWLRAGVAGLGDSRIENIETLRRAGVATEMTLIRTPMLSQADQVVARADVSFNSELKVIRGLSSAARDSGRTHGIVLMVSSATSVKASCLTISKTPFARRSTSRISRSEASARTSPAAAEYPLTPET